MGDRNGVVGTGHPVTFVNNKKLTVSRKVDREDLKKKNLKMKTEVRTVTAL